MRKLIAGGVLAATIVGGSVAVATVSPMGLAGAQSEAEQPAPPDAERPRPGQIVDEVLDELVAEGTLDQAQADAVRQRLEAKVGELRPGDGEHRGPRHRPFGQVKDKLEPAAQALGLSVEQLGQALRQGRSLNQIADEQGVDRGVVRQALIDQANARIDQGVADGKLDATRAEELKAEVPGRIDQLMDRTMQHPSGNGRGRGPQGPPAGSPAQPGG